MPKFHPKTNLWQKIEEANVERWGGRLKVQKVGIVGET